jgi:hypothetical protein
VNAELKAGSPRNGRSEPGSIEIVSNYSVIYLIFEGKRIRVRNLRDRPIKFRFVGTPG